MSKEQTKVKAPLLQAHRPCRVTVLTRATEVDGEPKAVEVEGEEVGAEAVVAEATTEVAIGVLAAGRGTAEVRGDHPLGVHRGHRALDRSLHLEWNQCLRGVEWAVT